MNRLFLALSIGFLSLLAACTPSQDSQTTMPIHSNKDINLDLAEANRLMELPLNCIQHPLPYKSGIIIAKEEDLAMPQVHHPAFYGCFDWHSAVHGHWSLVYLLKTFPNLDKKEEAIKMLTENLTAENIQQEVAYFSLNKESKSFERTYGWAWLLKLQEELYTWDHPMAEEWFNNIQPLAAYISKAYQEYLPKLYYPIRVGEHSNTGFGLSFAFDYAQTVGDKALEDIISSSAKRFYQNDAGCPISWEPSGYDFLSPCLQEIDIMRKVLNDQEFETWNAAFMPGLINGSLSLEPGKILDRSDGKLVHLDGLNFSRAWCLYALKGNEHAYHLATDHLAFSLEQITDGDYAGQHWLASFALYTLKVKAERDAEDSI
jgi:hypothetical protein